MNLENEGYIEIKSKNIYIFILNLKSNTNELEIYLFEALLGGRIIFFEF